MTADLTYETRPDPLSHPGRLGLSARLDGRAPAPLSDCRVLEFGCGDGAHLVPIVARHAGVTALGVELDPVAAARAREAGEALSLGARLSVETGDLSDFEPSAHARFDFVIAHGLYSWVAPAVRERLLASMCAALSERGVGYLSFNARPGWAVRGELRELLVRWAGDGAPSARVAGARRGLEVLRAALVDAETASARLLAEEVTRAREASDPYLLAEYLAPHNRAFDLSEVAASARDAGLRVLGELARASADGIRELSLARAIANHTADPDVVRRTADLLLSRQLRRLALARADAPSRPVRLGAALPELHLHATLQRIGDGADGEARFETSSDAVLRVREPAMLRALAALAARPHATVAVATLLGGVAPDEERALLEGLALLVTAGHARAWTEAVEVPAGARVSALAAYEQARRGWVSSALHEAVELAPPLARALADLSSASPEERQRLASLGLLA